MVIVSSSFCLKINQSRLLRVGEPVAQMLVTSSETAHPSGKQDLLLNQIALPIAEAEGSREILCLVISISRTSSEEEFAFQRFHEASAAPGWSDASKQRPIIFPLWEPSPFITVLTVTKELERWMKPAESVTIS